MRKLLALLAVSACIAFGQVAITTAPMDGTVTDPQGAVVVGATVTVLNVNTAANFTATTDDHGHWAVPSMPQAVYKVTVSMKGFRTAVIDNVVMDAGIPATVNTRLAVGAVTDTIVVSGAQELVQTTSATVNNSLDKRQMTELPMLTRNGLDMLMSMPGIQTYSANRYSNINGLPSGSFSITIDGVNSQDNTQKSASASAFYSFIPILQDSVEEVVVSGAAANADSTGEGAAMVKFVTRSGTAQFHGGAFWQNRNTFFEANSYFNTINHLPRSTVQLNQFGFHVGGPISIPKVMDTKNKLFFFTNVEFRILPQSEPVSRTIATPSAAAGNYEYADSTGALHTVNVLTLAKAAGFNATPDPIVTQTFSQVLALTNNCGSLNNLIPSGDYDDNKCAYNTSGLDRRHFSMSRVDYNLNSKNQLSITYSYNMFNAVPDIQNSVVPIYPGTGDILGTNILTGQTSNRFMGTIALRSTLTAHLTNSFQGGLSGGTVVFGAGVASDNDFAEWRGYVPSFAFGLGSGISTETAPTRRNVPVKQLSDTLTWLKGSHMVTFGGDFAQINFWGQNFGSETFPGISFGIATGDPVHNGSTDVFTAASMPGATQTQMDTAAAMYATLTGRVSSISRQVVEGTNGQYGNTQVIYHDQQRQFGFFGQDQWRVAPNLTFNIGLRFEAQNPAQNLSGTYTFASLQSVYGISGIGNMFKPGDTTGGMTPVAGGPAYAPYIPAFTKLGSNNAYNPPKSVDPNVGLAWQIPTTKGILGKLFGEKTGTSVLRAGFSIATIRETISLLSYLYGANNPGLTYPASVSPVTYPQYFGAPGSVLFSQGTLPVYPTPSAPTYPINTTPTASVNAFDPNLKLGYVESWNIGFQREFFHNNVIEIRYQGNHEVHGWRQVNVNEVNLFESGFLTDFYNAYNNLQIARGGNILNTNSNNFSNQGLPGQVNIPILQAALGTLTNNSSYATYIRQNRAGSLANVIYNNATYMGRLVTAGYPANLFIVNPSVASGGSYVVTNWGKSFWDAGVFEYRRRLANGLQLMANYVWSKALADGSTGDSEVYSEPTTFRNLGLDKAPPGFDVRQAFKINFIYELPFGAGKPFLSGNTLAKKVFGGWQVTGIDRNQTGMASPVDGGRLGMNNNDTGVVLENMTTKQLQSMMQITKTTGSNGVGQVWYLPQSPSTAAAGSTFVNNSQAAFEANGYNWTNLNVSTPYVAPQLAPDKFGYRVYLYGPMQNHVDFSLSKRTTFAKEKANLLIQANCFNCLNLTDFQLANDNPSSGSFGQTTTAYSDISNANDAGGRIIEFIVRVNF